MTELKDLRSATAFTYTDSLYINNCSVSTYTFTPNVTVTLQGITTFFTAVVDGTPFPAQNSFILQSTWWFSITTTTTFYKSYTFPGLTVTKLTPGQAIQMVNYSSCSQSL